MKNETRKKPLRIATFCASEFATPPKKMKDIYAPIWLLSYITEELIKRGHNVSLFAPKTSETKANLLTNNLPPLSHDKKFAKFYHIERKSETIWHHDALLLSKLYQMANQGRFDIVLIHLIGLRPLALAATSRIPTVFVLNDPFDPFRRVLFEQYKKTNPQIHFLGISKSQVSSMPEVFSKVIYHGIKIDNFPFNPEPGQYLITGGRLSSKKGIYEAIQAAKKTKEKLIIIGRHRNDAYWQKKIKPHLKRTIMYKGLVPYSKVPSLYSRAKAYLFPIKWKEPFGLVMIEAMACGTPVIAFRQGAAREIIQHGKTGFLVKPRLKEKPNIPGLVEAIKKINQIDRAACRKYVEQHFSIKRMVDDYEKLFYKLLKR